MQQGRVSINLEAVMHMLGACTWKMVHREIAAQRVGKGVVRWLHAHGRRVSVSAPLEASLCLTEGQLLAFLLSLGLCWPILIAVTVSA